MESVRNQIFLFQLCIETDLKLGISSLMITCYIRYCLVFVCLADVIPVKLSFAILTFYEILFCNLYKIYQRSNNCEMLRYGFFFKYCIIYSKLRIFFIFPDMTFY